MIWSLVSTVMILLVGVIIRVTENESEWVGGGAAQGVLSLDTGLEDEGYEVLGSWRNTRFCVG
jgi:hypothetical protein